MFLGANSQATPNVNSPDCKEDSFPFEFVRNEFESFKRQLMIDTHLTHLVLFGGVTPLRSYSA